MNCLRCVLTFGITILAWEHFAQAEAPKSTSSRTLWTTSKVFGTPDPPAPYRLEVAYSYKFDEPLAIATIPGVDDKLFVAERRGKIWGFPRDAFIDRKRLVLDLGRTIYGFAFHPRFQENGYFYVVNVSDPENPSPTGTRLSRFVMDSPTQLHAGKGSETVLLEWQSGGHNGGCLKFGPDGYLYLATGDGSGIGDEFETGQTVNDLLGALLRIDVDHPSEGRPYGIPADNPFVNQTEARPEIYAYGLRQLWKFSFDRQTGDLWGGEIGQDLWESVLKVQKGGNYGWSVREGRHPFRPDRPAGPTPILSSVVEHNHNDFRSVTGGFIYHGNRLPELKGCYIYSDYDTGRVWAFRYVDGKVTEHRELADTVLRLVEWGEEQDGELLLVDFTGGQLYRLQPNPPATNEPSKFPRKLSETGLFASTK
ncbi:MAG: PQQ-dependent sugar dehydrogenase, partial [Planctomycetaceae bacterium]